MGCTSWAILPHCFFKSGFFLCSWKKKKKGALEIPSPGMLREPECKGRMDESTRNTTGAGGGVRKRPALGQAGRLETCRVSRRRRHTGPFLTKEEKGVLLIPLSSFLGSVYQGITEPESLLGKSFSDSLFTRSCKIIGPYLASLLPPPPSPHSPHPCLLS